MNLKEKIQEALNHAKENGYTFEYWTPYNVAIDLLIVDAELEREKFSDVYREVCGIWLERSSPPK